MATKFSEMYSLFLSQITDYEIGQLSREDVEKLSYTYLIRGLINVQEIETDIMDINEEAQEFNNDLSLPERLIIAKSMKLEWLRDRIYQEDLMRQNIGDRDYKAVQGTAYLDSLRVLANQLLEEIRRDLLRNDWGKSSSYSRLMQ